MTKKNLFLFIVLSVVLGLTSACGKKKSSTATRVVNNGANVPNNFNNQTGTFNNNCGTQIGANCNQGLPQGATCESFPGYMTDPMTGSCVQQSGNGGFPQSYPQQGQNFGPGEEFQFYGYYQGYQIYCSSTICVYQ